jgi:hypothetical protein
MRFWKKAPTVEAVEAPPQEKKSEPSEMIGREEGVKYDI